MRTVYSSDQIVMEGDEVGRLRSFELEYMKGFDGATVKLHVDGEYPKLVIEALHG